jgi:hypothetical protein
LAKWIHEFHPELLQEPRLRFAVIGAEILDGFDDGRWYQTLPWLTGKPELKVEVVLVAPTLHQELLRDSIPSTERKTAALAPKGAPRDFAPADIVPAKVSSFLQSKLGQEHFDFFVLFNPGFSDPDYPWFSNGELGSLVARGVPIALSAYAAEELREEQWIVEVRGFRASDRLFKNPFSEGFVDVGSFAAALSELFPVAPSPDFRADPSKLARLAKYQEFADDFLNSNGHPLEADVGSIKTARLAETGVEVGCVVLPGEIFVNLAEGTFYGLEADGLHEFDDLREYPLSAEILKRYPKNSPFSFEHTLWAVEALIWANEIVEADVESDVELDGDDAVHAPSLNQMLGMLTGMTQVRNSLAVPGTPQANDDRLFPISAAQLKEGFAEFSKSALGTELDFDDFMRASRLRGGLDGIPFAAWYDFLEQQGWELADYDEDAELFEPYFSARSTELDQWVPVFVQGFSFIPDDETDLEAKEVMSVVEAKTDTALVVFKFMHHREIAGHSFTCGGLLLLDGVWSNFAINQQTNSIDVLLKQRTQKFDFSKVALEWEDKDSIVARSFNLFSKGLDADEVKEFVTMNIKDWSLTLPGDVPMI